MDCAGYLGNGGCEGGVPLYAMEYVQTKGIGAQATYKYLARDVSDSKFKIIGSGDDLFKFKSVPC